MTTAELHCPRDSSVLISAKEYGVDVDRCSTCKGAWYDHAELAMLEATVAHDEDTRRGMIDYAKRPSELRCPKCAAAMRAFNYRAHNLELDACPDEHGFWLDAGESERVRVLMQDRVKGLERSVREEEAWANLKRSGSGGLADNLRKLFRGS